MTPLLLGAAIAATSPAGTWVTEDGTALVRIEPCGSSICGSVERIIATGPDVPQTDVHNPSPALRERPLLGLEVLSGFQWTGSEWTGGRIYDPKTGKTYRSKLSLAPEGSLRVSGCVLFVCETQLWKPAR